MKNFIRKDNSYYWGDESDPCFRTVNFNNLTIENIDPMYTFASVFGAVEDYLRKLTAKAKVELKGFEKPQADAFVQREATVGEQVNKNILPRAVMMYNLDVNLDNIVNVPAFEQSRFINNGFKHQLMAINEKNFRYNCPDKEYDWRTDLNFQVAGHTKFSNALIIYTVIFSNYQSATNFARFLKNKFPYGQRVYLYESKRFDGGSQEYRDNTAPYQRDTISVPYYGEVPFPPNIVDALEISTGLTGDLDLLRFMQSHSHLPVAYTLDGGDRKRKYAYKYPLDPLMLVTTAIQNDEYSSSGARKEYSVRFEFAINYIEIWTFQLSAQFLQPNFKNPKWYTLPGTPKAEKEKENLVIKHPMNIQSWTEKINGTTRYDTLILKLTKEHKKMKIIKDEYGDPIGTQTYYQVNLKDFYSDIRLNKYIDEIINDYHYLDKSLYVNYEAARATRERELDYPNIQGMGPKFELDLQNAILNDYLSQEGDEIMIAVYINKKHFNDWLVKQAYRKPDNLADYN